MKAALESVLLQVRGVWRFRHPAVAVAWAVAVVGWLGVLLWPDSYVATARVYVDTSTALRPLLQGLAIESDVEARMNVVREQMAGADKLERVIREADLALGVGGAEDKNALVAKLRDRILIDVTLPSSARRDRGPTADRIFTISYQDESRDKALGVVRSLLNMLVEDTLGGQSAGANDAQQFLKNQISDYEKRLSEAEARLAQFKKSNVGLVPGETQTDFFSRLQTAIEAAKRAETNLELATRRRSELSRQLRGEQPFTAGGALSAGTLGPRATAAGASDTASRIADTQARLDELLLQFTDKHPDVSALRETLAQLQERQKAELAALRRGDPSAAATSGLMANPVYQSIQLQMNQVDVEIAALRGELSDHQRTVASLRTMLNTAPAVEAEFARLTRDYDVNRSQYTALLERLEKAKLSDDATQTGSVEFEIVEPPNASTKPTSPKRPLLLLAVLMVALSSGAGVAWLLAQLRPVFDTPLSLAEVTGFPVLGVVSMTWVERQSAQVRRSILRLSSAMAGLLAAFMIIFVFHEGTSKTLRSILSL